MEAFHTWYSSAAAGYCNGNNNSNLLAKFCNFALNNPKTVHTKVQSLSTGAIIHNFIGNNQGKKGGDTSKQPPFVIDEKNASDLVINFTCKNDAHFVDWDCNNNSNNEDSSGSKVVKPGFTIPQNFRGGFFHLSTGKLVLAPLIKMFNVGEQVSFSSKVIMANNSNNNTGNNGNLKKYVPGLKNYPQIGETILGTSKRSSQILSGSAGTPESKRSSQILSSPDSKRSSQIISQSLYSLPAASTPFQQPNFAYFCFKQNGSFGSISPCLVRERSPEQVVTFNSLARYILVSSKSQVAPFLPELSPHDFFTKLRKAFYTPAPGTEAHGNHYKYPETIRYVLLTTLLDKHTSNANNNNNNETLDEFSNQFVSTLESYSLIVELLDDKDDPHVSHSGKEEPRLVVTAIRELSEPFNYIAFEDCERICHKFGLEMCPFERIPLERWKSRIDEIESTGEFMGQSTEGVIVYAPIMSSEDAFFTSNSNSTTMINLRNWLIFKGKVMKLNHNYPIARVHQHYGIRRYARETFKCLLKGSLPPDNPNCPNITRLFLSDLILFWCKKVAEGGPAVPLEFSHKVNLLLFLDSFFFSFWYPRHAHAQGLTVGEYLSEVQMSSLTSQRKQHVLIPIGAQGSGKSTICRLFANLLERQNENLGLVKYVISDKLPVHSAYLPMPFETLVLAALADPNVTIVVADKMNLHKAGRSSLLRLLSTFNSNLYIHVVDLSYLEPIAFDGSRSGDDFSSSKIFHSHQRTVGTKSIKRLKNSSDFNSHSNSDSNSDINAASSNPIISNPISNYQSNPLFPKDKRLIYAQQLIAKVEERGEFNSTLTPGNVPDYAKAIIGCVMAAQRFEQRELTGYYHQQSTGGGAHPILSCVGLCATQDLEEKFALFVKSVIYCMKESKQGGGGVGDSISLDYLEPFSRCDFLSNSPIFAEIKAKTLCHREVLEKPKSIALYRYTCIKLNDNNNNFHVTLSYNSKRSCLVHDICCRLLVRFQSLYSSGSSTASSPTLESSSSGVEVDKKNVVALVQVRIEEFYSDEMGSAALVSILPRTFTIPLSANDPLLAEFKLTGLSLSKYYNPSNGLLDLGVFFNELLKGSLHITLCMNDPEKLASASYFHDYFSRNNTLSQQQHYQQHYQQHLELLAAKFTSQCRGSVTDPILLDLFYPNGERGGEGKQEQIVQVGGEGSNSVVKLRVGQVLTGTFCGVGMQNKTFFEKID